MTDFDQYQRRRILQAMLYGAEGTDRIAYNWFLYYYQGPKCNRKGPRTARCVLPPEHKGDHEGNGADEIGPRYERWAQTATAPTWKTPRRRKEREDA